MTSHLNLKLWKRIFVDHILSDIQWAIDAQRNLAAAQLLLSAADVISGLERPVEKEDTTRDIFIRWCDQHMALAGTEYTLNGLDLWGARCGFLHGYTPLARIVREGRARMLSYVDHAHDPVMGSSETPQLLIVSLRALVGALTKGMAVSMKKANSDAVLGALINQRMEMMFHSVDLPNRYSDL